MDLPIRPRRNRKGPGVRALTRETLLCPGDFVLPLFLHDAEVDEAIESMPGCMRWSLKGMVKEAGEALAVGVPAVILFPAIDDLLKTKRGEECFNREGLVQRAIRALKSAHPELVVMTDVALDPYNIDGHDGIVEEGEILNDQTVEILCKQAESGRGGSRYYCSKRYDGWTGGCFAGGLGHSRLPESFNL